MKITDVETILLTGPCTGDPFLSEVRKRRSVALIRISTDAGIVGIGETYGGYWFPEPIPEIVEFFRPILLGQDPERSDELWARMYHCGNFWCRVGFGPIVLCGIDAALWDIRGKAAGLPAYKLLLKNYGRLFAGADGFTGHARLPAYATGGPSNYPLEKLAAKIEFYLSLGFRGVKIGAGGFDSRRGGFFIGKTPAEASDFECEKTRFIRKRFGREFDLMYDGHMGNSPAFTWDYEIALAVLRSQEEFGLVFYEEPLHYNQPDGYAQLRKNTAIPVAGGECLATESEWEPFLEKRCFAVGQPDASYVSSLGVFMKIAAKLGAQGAKIAPHAWGAGASQMQNIHCGFACPNTRILETAPAYGPLHDELMGDSFRLKDGCILPPEKPGLGITLTQGTIDRFPFVRGSGEFNSVDGKVLED